MDKPKKILIITSDRTLRDVLKFCFDGWGYEVVIYDTMVRDIGPIKIISPDVIVVDVHAATKPELEICQMLKDDFITSFIPVITLINKRQLRSQLLNLKQGVDDYLIKPPDPLDLRIRVEMAMKRSQYSFYSSPLTGLPGGRIIEENLKERMEKSDPFSFGYLDLDNFKYFNDVYGYLKGDRVIMQTAYMLYTVIKKEGAKGDFIGHIGGDDFVFITAPGRYSDICHDFIATFDRIIPFHYSEADRKRGCIIARDRTRETKEIPFISVSIAVVNRGKPADFRNIIEINDHIAEIKRYLKGFPGSKFMEDRRNKPRKPGGGPEIHGRDENAGGDYAPLGEVLIRNGMITREKLEEVLPVHWRKGIMLGQTLIELGLINKEQLDAALGPTKLTLTNARRTDKI